MNLTLDIETLPSEDPAVRAELAAGITAPGNMSKAETIAAWEADKKPALVDQAMLKTSFDGAYGRVLCIGWAADDAEPGHIIGAEQDVLSGFVVALEALLAVPVHGGSIQGDCTFIGHNLAGFDLRFLFQRMAVNGIKPPAALKAAFKARAWDKSIADTMLMWSPDREKRISLDRLCKALGVETSKGDMDGSKVYEEYKAGNLDKIATYCRGDVTATRECWKRLSFA